MATNGKAWKPPAYQHYAKEWLVDTAHLSLEEQGAYQRLLDHQWVNAKLPTAERDRASLLAVTIPTFRRLWKRLMLFFPQGQNPRLEQIRQEQDAYRAELSKNGKLGAGIRWHAPANGGANGPANAPANGEAYGQTMRLQSASAPAVESKTKPSAAKPPRESWLKDFGKAWTAAYGGEPAYGQLANYLRPLTEAHPVGDVLEHWERYLEHTDGQYASVARFSSTYGEWGKRPREPEGVPDMYLTLEEQEARRAKLHAPKGVEAVGDILQRVLP